MLRAGRHTVEDAKTHGDRFFGMVSWGPYGAEGVIGLFTDNSVNGRAQRADRPAGRLAGARRDMCIAVQHDSAFARYGFEDLFDISGRMNARDLLDLRNRRFAPLQVCVLIVGQCCMHRAQPRRRLRMHGPGVVVHTAFVGKENRRHNCLVVACQGSHDPRAWQPFWRGLLERSPSSADCRQAT